MFALGHLDEVVYPAISVDLFLLVFHKMLEIFDARHALRVLIENCRYWYADATDFKLEASTRI